MANWGQETWKERSKLAHTLHYRSLPLPASLRVRPSIHGHHLRVSGPTSAVHSMHVARVPSERNQQVFKWGVEMWHGLLSQFDFASCLLETRIRCVAQASLVSHWPPASPSWVLQLWVWACPAHAIDFNISRSVIHNSNKCSTYQVSRWPNLHPNRWTTTLRTDPLCSNLPYLRQGIHSCRISHGNLSTYLKIWIQSHPS